MEAIRVALIVAQVWSFTIELLRHSDIDKCR